MNKRTIDGIVTIISGAVLILSGIVTIAYPVEPAWLPLTISIISAIVTVIFGAKLVKG